MTLKVRILRCSRRLFIILVSLTMTWFSEKMLTSTRCIHGFMSNLIKKSWTDSISHNFITYFHRWDLFSHQICSHWLVHCPHRKWAEILQKKKGNIRNIKLKNQNFFDFLKLDIGYAFFQIVRYSDWWPQKAIFSGDSRFKNIFFKVKKQS